MSEITNTTRTPVKVGYLVIGLVFVGLAGSWALSASGAVDDVTVAWLLPAILVGAGVVGLLAMLAGGVLRRRPGADTEPDRDDPHVSTSFDDPEDTRTIPEEDHR